MVNDIFIYKLKNACGRMRIGEMLCGHTTFRVGGPCIALAEPISYEEICNVIKLCREYDVPYFVIGRGSNLLVSDEGYNGVVIKIGSGMANLHEESGKIYAQAGCTLSALAFFAFENGIGGFEFASGIPGSVGGGIRMNAGAYGREIKDILESCCYLGSDGSLNHISAFEAGLRYRGSMFCDTDDLIILSAVFAGIPNSDKEEIRKKMNELNGRRREKQPLEFASAGSTFKRPEGYFAAKLIEDCGLKGYSCGKAAVSEKHAGFVVNRGGATCSDIVNVIKYIRNAVYWKSGVMLEPEVVILGNIEI